MKHFSSHVNGMFIKQMVKRKLNKTNKNLQHGQLICREIFTEDNTEPH